MNILKFVSMPSLHFQPYVITNKKGETLYVEEAKLIPLISESLRIPYEVVIPEDGAYGMKLRNGTWTGMMGMLGRAEADLAVGYIGIYAETPPGVNFIYPHLLSEDTFMGNKPEPLTTKEAIVYPFSYEVWIMISFSLVFVTLLLYLLMKRKRALPDIFFALFGSLLEKSIDFKIYTSSIRIVIVTWMTAIFVLSSGYKGVLLSFLTFPTLVGIRDIQDLSRAAITNSVNCYTYRGSSYVQRLSESNIGTWKTAGECLKRNEMSGVLENYTPEEIFLNATGKKVFITGKIFLIPYEKLYFISKDCFSVEMYFIFYSKTFCCPKHLNSLISRFNAAGLIGKIKGDEAFFTERNALAQFPETKQGTLKKVQFSDFSGAFIMLLSGWILGFFTLLAELAVNKFFYSKQIRCKGAAVNVPAPGVMPLKLYISTISYHR